MMQPTAELLAELPKRIAERWKQRKDQIAANKAQLTKRLAELDTLNQMAITSRIKNEISAQEFEAFKMIGSERREIK